MEPNTLLDALLDEAGISHAGLATQINEAGRARGMTLRYEHTAVARWLKGQRPRGRVPDLICEVLGEQLHRPSPSTTSASASPGDPRAPPATALSGFVERATALWRSDEQQRPHVMDAAAVTGAPAVMPGVGMGEPARGPDVSRHGRTRVIRPTSTCCTPPAATTSTCTARPGASRPAPGSSASSTPRPRPCCAAPTATSTGRELYRAAGGAGRHQRICAYDANAQGLAQRYFHQALRLGKASGDRLFGGYVIALLVNQALFMGDRQAVAFAEAVLRAAGRR